MTHSILRADDLRDMQRQMVRLGHEHPAMLLVSPMASGKTGGFLKLCQELLDSFEVRRILIAAPLRVAETVWPEEAKTWAFSRNLSIAVAVGKPAERAAAVDRGAEITVINVENLVWLYEHVGGVRGWPFDCLIVDESSLFKAGKKRTTTTKTRVLKHEAREVAYGAPVSPPEKGEDWMLLSGRKGHRDGPAVPTGLDEQGRGYFDDPFEEWLGTRDTLHLAWQRVRVTAGGNLTRFGVLAAVRKKLHRVYGLTGTPGDVHKLWGQVYLLDLGERLGSSITAFENRWFDKNQYSYAVTPKEGAREGIMTAVSDIMFALPPPPDLPKATTPEIRVDLSPKILSDYARFKRDLFSEPHEVNALSAGVLANKILQFSAGFMYREDRSVAHIHSAKLDALGQLISVAAGDPLLVFYAFAEDFERIKKLYPKVAKLNETKNFMPRWNNGELKVVAAHPASCSHGLNLQHGGHLAAWYSYIWDREKFEQASTRLPRPGQKWPVSQYRIITNGTDEDRLLSVLADGTATESDMTRMVMRTLAPSGN